MYCVCNSLIKDVEIMVDGVSAGRQQYPDGSIYAIVSGTKSLSTPGTHTVAIHMISQTVSPTTWTISGGANAINTATNSQVTILFPQSATIATDGKLEIKVNVP